MSEIININEISYSAIKDQQQPKQLRPTGRQLQQSEAS